MNKPHKEVSKRRKEVLKLMRQKVSPLDIAEKLELDVDIIYKDIEFINSQKAEGMLYNKSLLENLGKAQLEAIQSIEAVDAEAWKIYYNSDKDSLTQLQALEKIRQNTLDKAKILKVLSTGGVNVQINKVQYVYQVVLSIVARIVDIVTEYVPKERQVEMLQKLHAINLKEEIEQNGKDRLNQ